MKLTKYAAMAAMTAMLAACSSEESGNPGLPENPDGTARYLSIGVSLDAASSARSVEMTAGTEAEYSVDDATLVILKAQSGDYNVVETVGAESVSLNAGSGDIDKTATLTFKVAQVTKESAGDYYALLVLNKGTMTLPTTTYNTWAETAQASTFKGVNEKNHFTMTNALGWVGAATADEPTALTPLTLARIYNEGETGTPAATIFVQRIIAKVTVKDNHATDGYTVDADKVKITNWTLDNMESTTYPMQKLGGVKAEAGISAWTSAGRFVGGTEFSRVYWTEDPHYAVKLADAERYTAIDKTADDAIYCFENTFGVDFQKEENSTRIIFKGVYTPATLTEGDSFVKFGAKIKKVEASDIATGKKGGSYALSEVIASSSQADVKEALGAADTDVIDYYENGEVYYVVIVRHFDDTDTPWNADTDYGYNTGDAKFLGRYGIVRNNWYEFTIGGVSKIGTPDVPEVTEEWDDPQNPTYAIDVTVNILKWAKRGWSGNL